MKKFALLSTWVVLVFAGSPNALASSAYTCTTYAHGSAQFTNLIGINNKGQIVGTWTEATTTPAHAFLRSDDGSITPLLSPGGDDEFTPVAINNLGQILGQNATGGFILNPDGSYKQLAPPAYFSGLNDKGELSGTKLISSPNPDNMVAIFIRGADGNDKILDSDLEGTLEPGPINNSEAVIEHRYHQGLDGFLLYPNGSKTPLALPGVIPGEDGSGDKHTSGLNNNNLTAGDVGGALFFKFAYLNSLDGHYRAIFCPDYVNANLYISGVNDQNTVVGNFYSNSPFAPWVGFIATPTGLSPHAQLSDSSWTFGSHGLGEQSGPGKVFLSNTGAADLHVPTVYLDQNRYPSEFLITESNCGVWTTDPTLKPVTIPPGESCFVKFTFTPQMPGLRTVTIYIPNDALDSPQTIQVEGTGIGSMLHLSNTSWTFAAHKVGETSGNGVIYASNSGPGFITFQDVHILGPVHQPNFHLISNSCGSLAPHATCAFTFNFTPKTPGDHLATLSVTSNALNGGTVHIHLHGHGN